MEIGFCFPKGECACNASFMRMLHLLNIMLLLPLLMGTLYAQTQVEESFYHLQVADGLPSEKVYHILQDQAGFMWFATESGLCRYDGYQFKNFTVTNGISKNEIHRMYQAHDSALWILTLSDLAVMQKDLFTIVDTFQGIKTKRVLSLLQDSTHNMWLTTVGNVHMVRPTGEIFHFNQREFEAKATPGLAFVAETGEVWLSAGDHFYTMLDTSVKQKIPLKYPIQGAGISFSAAAYLSDRKIVYSSQDGLVLMEPDYTQHLAFQSREGFDPKAITALLADINHRIWVASASDGVMRFRVEGQQLVKEAHMLEGMGVNHLRLDREGNLWIATANDGLFMRSRNAAAINVIELPEPQEPFLGIVRRDDAENLWFIGERGTIQILEKEGGSRKIDLSADLRVEEHITELEILDDGSLLIGTNKGLLAYRGGKTRRLFGMGRIATIKQLDNGDILLGSAYEAYRCTQADLAMLEDPSNEGFPSSEFEEVARIDPSITYPEVQHMMADLDGSTWISQVNGLYHLIGQERVNLADRNTIFRTNIRDMEQTQDGNVWVATNGSGLIVINTEADTFHVIDAEGGLPGEVVNDIFLDGDTAIWLATNNGLGKIKDYDFEQREFSLTSWYNQKDGLLDANVTGVQKYDGKLYALTRKGISLLDEAQLNQENIRPPVYIIEVRVNDEKRDLKEELTLSYQENNIHLFFTGLAYRNLGRVRFKYRLEGGKENDEKWKETFQTNLIYAGLAPGEYEFQVIAQNQEGVESVRSAKFSFAIEPPVYQRPWFLALLSLLIMLVIFLLLRYFYINQQRTHLQRLVNEKTAELNENLNELTRANRELEQFAYAASHDLKTPLRTVIGHLQLLEKRYRGRLDSDADEFIAFAVGGAKKMNVMINDLLNYARVGRQKMTFVEVDLNETLASVTRMLGIVINKPNITVSVADLPVITGIPTQWELLFQNLIENGLKFNHSENPEIRVYWEDSPDFWRIFVADNGIGIAEEYQAKIFELFQRLHTTEFPGTGIGLAMCKKIVELHNGSIFIDSKMGSGTTFCITVAKDL